MKTWIKPQLIVLARGRPEEYVLQTCKTSPPVGTGYGNNPCYVHVKDVGTGESGFLPVSQPGSS